MDATKAETDKNIKLQCRGKENGRNFLIHQTNSNREQL